MKSGSGQLDVQFDSKDKKAFRPSGAVFVCYRHTSHKITQKYRKNRDCKENSI